MQFRRIRSEARVLLALGGILMGAMIAQADEDTKPAVKSPPKVTGPIAMTVKTDKKTYKANEPIKITLSAKNTRKEALAVAFSSGQQYDIEIRRGKGREGEKVWQWAKGRMFPMMIMNQRIEAEKSLTFTETYDPAKKEMPSLSPGTYTVFALLKTMGRTPPPSGTTVITVK